MKKKRRNRSQSASDAFEYALSDVCRDHAFQIGFWSSRPISPKRVCRIVSAVGKRAFLPKIDGRLTMPETHKMMRHGSFQTTTDHYDTRTAVDIAAKLWNT